MGFSISWLAIKTEDLTGFFELAGVSPTTEADEWLESPISGGGWGQGWYLLQAQGCDHPMISGDSLSKLSALGEVIACSVEEHLMVSTAESWNQGSRNWRLIHNAQEGMYHLSADGDLPSHYASIKEELFSQQNSEGGEDADVDLVFEIPLEVARKLCGYKHDEDCTDWVPPGPVTFRSMTGVPEFSTKPWWKFW